MAFGLTTTGFVPKTLADIREAIASDIEADFGPSAAAAARSDTKALGVIVAIVAERLAELWELGETVNSGQNPDTATGTLLEAICALTGTVRNPATASTVTETLTGTPSTVVSSGSQVSVSDSGERFATDADATITAVAAWSSATAYTLGDRVYNGSPEKVYQCTVAGTSAGSGGPTGTGSAIADNTVTWRYLGDGTGAIDAAATAVNSGEVQALSGTLTEIETPVAGWDSAINVLDADEGSAIETDEDLRVRRETELAASGSSPIDALRAALLDVDDVTTVKLFVNNTDTTDADGVPPHAVEALIQGGADQDIWDALLANVAAGIATHGTEAGTAEDNEGTTHDMEFSRPSEIDIYVDVTLTYDASLYPSDGDTQIKEAIVDMGDAQSTGKDAVSSRVKAACFDVAGVLDVSLAYLDTSPGPSSEATITIDPRELAVFDTSRITVTSSSATP